MATCYEGLELLIAKSVKQSCAHLRNIFLDQTNKSVSSN